jgi:hypothetical protein
MSNFLLLILFIILIILIIVLWDYDSQNIVGGVVEFVTKPKAFVIDGLNHIHKQLNKDDFSYPNILTIHDSIKTISQEYKSQKIYYVLKNQDGKKLLESENELMKLWAKKYKITILYAYDPSDINIFTEHYMKGRDDMVVLDTAKYLENYDVHIISQDKYQDKNNFSKIPKFELIKYK